MRGTELGRKWDFSISGTTSSKSRFLRLDGIAFPLKKKKQQPLLRSYQRLGIHDKALMDALSRRTMQSGFLLTFKAQGVANTAWAYATLGIHDKALMDSLSRRTMQCGFLLNTAWAYATLGIHNKSQPTTKALCQTPPISITGMCCEVQMAAMPDCGACLGRVARARGSAQISVTHGGTGLGRLVKAWPDGAPRPGTAKQYQNSRKGAQKESFMFASVSFKATNTVPFDTNKSMEKPIMHNTL